MEISRADGFLGAKRTNTLEGLNWRQVGVYSQLPEGQKINSGLMTMVDGKVMHLAASLARELGM